MAVDLESLVRQLGQVLESQQRYLATAESCTGGWVAMEVTAIPGSSHWFDRGFVTYTSASKQEMLGVQEATLKRHGAVSEAVVREMAEGALEHSHADVALSISGVAGPGGGSPKKPVGTVWFAWAGTWFPTVARMHHVDGDRQQVRRQSVVVALQGVLELVGNER